MKQIVAKKYMSDHCERNEKFEEENQKNKTLSTKIRI